MKCDFCGHERAASSREMACDCPCHTAPLPAGPAAPQTPLLEVADRLKTEMVWQRAHGNDTWPTLAADIELLADAILSRASSPSPSAALREKIEQLNAEVQAAWNIWGNGYAGSTAMQEHLGNAAHLSAKLAALLGSTESP